MSPMTRATALSERVGGLVPLQGGGLSRMPSKPKMRKCPQRVGKSASAMRRNEENGMAGLYDSPGAQKIQPTWHKGVGTLLLVRESSSWG